MILVMLNQRWMSKNTKKKIMENLLNKKKLVVQLVNQGLFYLNYVIWLIKNIV